MSLTSLFYENPIIFYCSLVILGFGAGIATDQFFVERFKELTGVEKYSLISENSKLNETVKLQKQKIDELYSSLSSTQVELSNRQSKIGSDNYSIQTLNQKYNDLYQQYQKLNQLYNNSQNQYQIAQFNCNIMTRLNSLESEKRSLVNQLNSVNVFDRDIEGTKQDIRLQIQQNHDKTINLQSNLKCI